MEYEEFMQRRERGDFKPIEVRRWTRKTSWCKPRAYIGWEPLINHFSGHSSRGVHLFGGSFNLQLPLWSEAMALKHKAKDYLLDAGEPPERGEFKVDFSIRFLWLSCGFNWETYEKVSLEREWKEGA